MAATNFQLWPIPTCLNGKGGRLQRLSSALSGRWRNAELLHQTQVVHLVPTFHDLAARASWLMNLTLLLTLRYKEVRGWLSTLWRLVRLGSSPSSPSFHPYPQSPKGGLLSSVKNL